MDPELRAYLDEIRRELSGQIDGVQNTVRAEIRAGDAETRSHMDVLHEETQRQLRAAEEGRQAILEQIGRRFEEYHEKLVNEHIALLETSMSSVIRRVDALEQQSR